MSEITDPAAGIVTEVAAPVKKTCTKCGVEKVLEEFSLKTDGRFGRSSRCKHCFNVYYRNYQQRPEVAQRRQAYRQSSRSKEQQRAYNRSREAKMRQKIYRQSPKFKDWQRAYCQRPEFKAWQRSYVQRRRRNSSAFRIAQNLRRRLRSAIKMCRRSGRTMDLLGCSIRELQQHLAAQFKPGMTWANYGKYGWHIDHIRPCASFDLADPEQQKACFHYTNLQPLWATDNLRKSNKLPDSSALSEPPSDLTDPVPKFKPEQV